MAGIGSAPGILIGFGVGAAASAALEPAFEVPRQQAWANAPYRILELGQLAAVVAQGGISLDDAIAEAKLDGYGSDKLDAMIYLAQTVPGVGEATNLWRRGLLSDDLYGHVLVKAGLDQRYVDPIIANKLAEPIGLGDIAFAIVRGILPPPSYVPVPVPAQGDKVPRYPVVDVDPEALAAKLGYDPQALEILVGRSGLSMAPVMAANALFREIIGDDDYLIAIGEGDLRTEWGEAVKEVSRAIPVPGEYASGVARGRITVEAGEAGAARHGMTAEDADFLTDLRQHSPSAHQIVIGLARGATYPGTWDMVPEPFQTALKDHGVREEWGSIWYESRYNYPSPFVIRSLATGGEWDEATTKGVLLDIGWKPDLVDSTLQAWYGTTATTADKHVSKAQTQLWTKTHTSYIAGEISDQTATAALGTAGVTTDSIPSVLQVWGVERDLIRKQLSAAEIKKAYSEGVVNPLTNAPWTQQEAISRLVELGYNPTDAATLLEL